MSKFVSLSEERSFKGKDTLYVVNTSEKRNDVMGKSAVFFHIGKGTDDEGTPVTVPRTWVPVNLADLAPREAILINPRFTRCLSEELLAIVSDEYAEKVLATEDAQLELRRLREENVKVQNETRVKGLNPDDEVQAKVEEEQKGDGIPEAFKSVVSKTNAIKDERLAASELKSYGVVNNVLLKYLAHNTVHLRIRKWAEKRMEEGEED